MNQENATVTIPLAIYENMKAEIAELKRQKQPHNDNNSFGNWIIFIFILIILTNEFLC